MNYIQEISNLISLNEENYLKKKVINSFYRSQIYHEQLNYEKEASEEFEFVIAHKNLLDRESIDSSYF